MSVQKEHNTIVKSLKPYSDFMRKTFFKENLGAFKDFLEPKMIKSLESFDLSAKPPSPGMKAFKEIMVQPSILQGDMRDYQLMGLNFVAKMHHLGTPCILGDEMGLGKTYQTISLICYLKENLKQSGPSLIVCPLSVLSSWEAEFKVRRSEERRLERSAAYHLPPQLTAFCSSPSQKWAPSLKTIQFHENEFGRKQIVETLKEGFSSFDAVITTYEMLKVKGEIGRGRRAGAKRQQHIAHHYN